MSLFATIRPTLPLGVDGEIDRSLERGGRAALRARCLRTRSPQPRLVPGRLRGLLGAGRGMAFTSRTKVLPGSTRGGLEIVRSASHQGFAVSRRVEADISRRFVEEFNPAADKGGRQGVPTVRWPLQEAVRWPSRATIHDPATASRGNPQEAAKKWWPSDGCDSRPFEAVPPPNRTLRVHRHGPGGRSTGQMDLLSALRRFPCRTPRAKRRLPCVNLTLSLDVLLGG